ncbi:MAG TPA: cupin-like domain-containing protein [Methylocella sp.]|jgi:hypothetical protein
MSSVLDVAAQPPMQSRQPVLLIDREKFKLNFNKRHFLLGHRLRGNPLLSLPRIIELARDTARIRPEDLYYDAGVTDIDERWGTSPSAFPVDETIRRIETAGAWIALKGAEKDPAYAALLNDCMSDLLDVSGRDLERKMRRKEVIIFVTSPNRVTTYHIDSECNFLLQVEGSKDISIFPQDDREVLPETEIEQFWTIDRNAARYKPHLQHHADRFTLEPGMGVHIPINAPHWVQNGDNVSIAVSINYHSYASERANIYRLNYYLRHKLGVTPTPPFRSPARDFVKRSIGKAYMTLRGKPDT